MATHQREPFLAELLTSLALQEDAPAYDVVVVDDASSDATWERLRALVGTAEFPVLALRVGANSGPSVARNTGVLRARGEWVAFTDDDCLPTSQWLAALLAASAGVALVQGSTRPVAGGPPSDWARTIRIGTASPLYETCNLAVDKGAFLRHNGFPVLNLLPGASSGRGFGEDAVLGSLVAHSGGAAFAPDAVVCHRWLPGSYLDHLRGEWRLVGFPFLADLVPETAAALWHGVFLTPRTAEVDAAIAGLLAAVLLRRRWAALAAVPWITRRVRDARRRNMTPVPVRAAQLAFADAVGLVALVRGSVRARRIVL